MGEERGLVARVFLRYLGFDVPAQLEAQNQTGWAMTNSEQFQDAMRLALSHALRGPAHGVNPQVGAVILNPDGQVVAEGWHLGSGTAHAEVAALANLAQSHPNLLDRGRLPSGYTAVVTLEPCNHTGKTGPCSEALILAGISRVVFAVADPGIESAGGGQRLRDAGVEVISGVLDAEAREQLRIWLTATARRSPFVTLKWASSLDGRAAANDGTSKWISGPESRTESHQRRAKVDAIMVGTGTVLADDPELTARKPDATLFDHQPLRVIMGERDLPPGARVFNDSAETLQIKSRSIPAALDELYSRGVRHLWVEGGPQLASDFVRQNLVDEFLIYLSPQLLGGNRYAIGEIGVESMPMAVQLEFSEFTQLGSDLLIRARRRS